MTIRLPIPHAKQSASEAMDLLQSLASDLVREHPEAAVEVTRIFFTQIRGEIDVLMPPAKTPAPMQSPRAMTDSEARAFESESMPFGKHIGEPIGQVPADYLLYLDENQFATKLRRYLSSERFQKVQA